MPFGWAAYDQTVKRLVHTSRGWIELDLDQMEFAGFNIRVAVFGEDGWASAEETWNATWPVDDKSFEAFLADIAGVPRDEAAQIAQESIDKWRARGGEIEEREEKRKVIAWLASVLGLAALGALALLAVVIIVVLKLT